MVDFGLEPAVAAEKVQILDLAAIVQETVAELEVAVRSVAATEATVEQRVATFGLVFAALVRWVEDSRTDLKLDFEYHYHLPYCYHSANYYHLFQ